MTSVDKSDSMTSKATTAVIEMMIVPMIFDPDASNVIGSRYRGGFSEITKIELLITDLLITLKSLTMDWLDIRDSCYIS